MDEDLSYYFYLLGNCFFVSDIMQQNWIYNMQPIKSMIKFRCPYGDYKIKTFNYLDDDILLQP